MTETYRNIADKLYRDFGFDKIQQTEYGEVILCHYCNNKATGKDHIPALNTIRKILIKGDLAALGQHKCVTVACCESCNKRLKDKPLMTPEARKEYIEHNNFGNKIYINKARRGRKRIPETYGYYVNLYIEDIASAVKILHSSGKLGEKLNVSALFRTILEEWLEYNDGGVLSIDEAKAVLLAYGIPLGNQGAE